MPAKKLPGRNARLTFQSNRLFPLPSLGGYLFAIAVTVGGLILRAHIAGVFIHRPLLIVMVLPVIASAFVGGLGPGLLSTLIVAMTSAYISLQPFDSFAIAHHYDRLLWSFLVLDGVLMSSLAYLVHRSWRDASEVLAERLRESHRLEAIVDSSNDAIISKDLDGIITSWNAGAEYIFGYTSREAVGQPIAMLFVPGTEDQEQGLLERLRRGERVPEFEAQRMRKDGRLVTVSVVISPLRDERGQVIGASKIARDITERILLEDEIRQLAFYDPLTGLPNRRLLNDRLHQAMATSRRNGKHAAVIFLDLDNFKELNDQHGHDLGDLLLIDAAKRIQACLRETDTVARFGGDEFVVILSGLSVTTNSATEQAQHLAEQMRQRLAEPFRLTYKKDAEDDGFLSWHCTASIGITLYQPDHYSAEDLLKQADTAMYEAKASGRDRIRSYDPANKDYQPDHPV
ncbi:MAG: diguanylate cyclase [Candidatus Thiodiazotropha sp.]